MMHNSEVGEPHLLVDFFTKVLLMNIQVILDKKNHK
jgi:hypothetical protein